MHTISARKEDVKRRWLVIDAADQPVGRLASRVASVLRGKHKAIYTPHVDTGDFVIVINAGKLKLTGSKPVKKIYYRHSGHPGGIRAMRAGDLLANKPDYVLERAVKGMLPKNSLGRDMFQKLKIYADGTHPHAAQKPDPF